MGLGEWCNVWPPDMYAEMERYFPPISAMEAQLLSVTRNAKNAKAGYNKAGYSADGSNNLANKRYKISGFDFIKHKPAAMGAEEHAGSKDVWMRVKKILFSPKLEAAMWKKFHVTRNNMAHDFRLQIDTAGYSIGRGLHSSICQLNVSACGGTRGIQSVFRGCLWRGWRGG
jgi:hypothetical protein